jgi:hypothetical protein
MRPIRKLSLGRVTTVWGVLFAIVHTYWAAGGAAGMDGEPADTLGAQLYIGFIAVLGLAGAAVAHGLDRDACRRALILLARGGGVVLLLGVLFGTLRWVGDGETDGAGGFVITLYFLLGGMLFSMLGWFGRRVSG